MLAGDARDASAWCLGASSQQRPASTVQSPEARVGHRAHAEKLGAEHPERSLRYTDGRREPGHREWAVRARGDGLLETAHDDGVTLAPPVAVLWCAVGHQIDERVDDIRPERPSSVGIRGAV